MMKIIFFGDSITDFGRNKERDDADSSLGYGFVRIIADRLIGEKPGEIKILNRGYSGDRIIDLYARLKKDCINLAPDVVSILVGINDVWHEIAEKNGIDIERFEEIYRMLIEDLKKALPATAIILCEPFVLPGGATESDNDNPDRYEKFCEIYNYAAIVKKLANEYELLFLPLQEAFTEKAKKYSPSLFLSDGVHPNIAGVNLIAGEWVKLFKEKIAK